MSWWERIRRALAGSPRRSGDERFLAGKTAIHYGVLFRVDPNDEESLIAALPLVTDSDKHVRRNIDEACRVASEFLMTHPNLIDSLRDRKLIVSMISSYADPADEIRREVIPAMEWNRLGGPKGG